ncbi:MAG: hypothetical protein AAF913_00130 [Pseudomonadota bacterium]
MLTKEKPLVGNAGIVHHTIEAARKLLLSLRFQRREKMGADTIYAKD